jgi:cysteine-rich repeat protein
MMTKWAGLVAVGLLQACVSPGDVVCANGYICPQRTTCVALDEATTICAPAEQLAACTGIDEGMACTYEGGAGACEGGACVLIVCGDLRMALGEACDDGNTESGDGCSSDCKSNEACGNTVVDPFAIGANGAEPNEQCDDGNRTSGDGCSSTCFREEVRWSRVDDTIPRLSSYGATYDAGRDRIVLFGGYMAPGYTDQTFEWTGASWVRIDVPIRPQPRAHHVMAYDASRRRVVMFGGSAGSAQFPFGDTWEWDGNQWTLQTPAVSPPARSSAGMVYDGARKRVVLFGGYSGSVDLGDVWEWDGTTWTEVTIAGNKPAPRFAHQVGYDPKRNVIVVVGGHRHDPTKIAPNDRIPTLDTWELANGAWQQVTTAPAELGGTQVGSYSVDELSAMTYDAAGSRFVAYGKLTYSATTAKTFAYNGTSWTDLAVTTTGVALTGVQLVSDPGEGVIYLYGGRDEVAGTLTVTRKFSGNGWTALINNGYIPPKRFFHAGAYDPKRGVEWIFGGDDDTETPIAQLVSFDGSTWRSYSPTGTPPSPRSGPALAYDRKNDRVVVFGGQGVAADTFVYSPTANTWTSSAPTPSPGARSNAAMAYDAKRERTVLFGGIANGVMLNETWEWNGSAWTLMAPAAPPPARAAAAMTYDEARERIVMYAGVDVAGARIYNDVWTYDGVTWTPVAMDSPTVTRIYPAMGYDRANSAMLLFGGFAPAGAALNDVWTWDGAWRQQLVERTPPPSGGQVAFTAPNGAGVMFHAGGPDFDTGGQYVSETWRARFQSDAPIETCALPMDNDRDGQIGCADADCAASCSACGDGTCGAQENCRICAMDCTCSPACGDSFCDAGETQTSCPGDCTP